MVDAEHSNGRSVHLIIVDPQNDFMGEDEFLRSVPCVETDIVSDELAAQWSDPGVFERSGVLGTQRPEELTLEQFARLAESR